MIIKIDEKTMLNVAEDYYAPMYQHKDKRAPEGFVWLEYKWFTSLEGCIKYLVQKKLSEKEETVEFSKFVKYYKEAYDELRSLLQENNLT